MAEMIRRLLFIVGSKRPDFYESLRRTFRGDDTVQIVLLVLAALVVACAEIAAVLVYRSTSGTEEEGAPPRARMRFFAAGAMAGNLVFFTIIVLTGVATVSDRLCHQA